MQATQAKQVQHWESEYPFQSRWLDLGAYRLHYFAEGHGRPLLMVHGNPTWSFLWRNLARELRHDYRPVAIDHVGCGLSDKPRNLTYSMPVHVAHLVTLIDKLDLQDATMMVHDWGGPIGLSALLTRRERFSSLVVFNTGAFPPPFIPWRIPSLSPARAGAGRRARVESLRKIGTNDGGAPTSCHQRLGQDRHDLTLRQLEPPTSDLSIRPGYPRIEATPDMEASATTRKTTPRIGRYADPAHLGYARLCFRPSCLDRFQRFWPDAEVVKLNVGHWVTEEAPQAVLSHVSQFLRKLERD